jgi:hypothetical protein
MGDELEALRQRIERFYAGAGRSQLERWRGAAQDGPIGPSRLSYALQSDQSTEAVQAAHSSGRISAAQQGWLEAHLARIRLGLALTQRRARLARRLHAALSTTPGGGDAVGRLTALLGSNPGSERNEGARALERLAEPLVADWLELLAVLRERADAPPPAPVLEQLEAFMKGTDGLADEIVGRLRVGSGRGSQPWAELLLALRARPLDGFTAARDRHRRVAMAFEGLGFAPEMARSLSVEPAVASVSAGAELAVLDAPQDIRIGPSRVQYGLWADQCMARALGRAVALALVSPGLPVEQRWPLPDACGALLGGLLAQLLADPLCARRELGYSARDAEQVARHQAALLVLSVRARVAVALAGAGRDAHDALERLEQAMERAVRVPVPGAFVALLGARPEPWREAEAAVQGLAMATGLRERFDEDWFRNPAVGAELRGVCVLGNGGSAAQLFALADVGRPRAALERAIELAAP